MTAAEVWSDEVPGVHRLKTVRPGQAPGAGQAPLRTQLAQLTPGLLNSLQAKLADIRESSDPEGFALAVECEAVIEEIRAALAAMGSEQR